MTGEEKVIRKLVEIELAKVEGELAWIILQYQDEKDEGKLDELNSKFKVLKGERSAYKKVLRIIDL